MLRISLGRLCRGTVSNAWLISSVMSSVRRGDFAVLMLFMAVSVSLVKSVVVEYSESILCAGQLEMKE